MKRILLWALGCLLLGPANQALAGGVQLDNGTVYRNVTLKEGKVYTDSLALHGEKCNFTARDAREFSFRAGGIVYDGNSGWSQQGEARRTKDAQGGERTEIRLRSTAGSPLDVVLAYTLYPGSPAMRKSIRFVNVSQSEVTLEAVEVEKLRFTSNNNVLFSSYGRQKHLNTYWGDCDDALVMMHDYTLEGGVLLANEAPGVLKGVSFNTTYQDISMGLSGERSQYPFRKYLAAGAQWETPSVITMPYLHSPDPGVAMNGPFAEFQLNYSGYTIYTHPERRLTFMYNNYVPFNDKYDAGLILEVAEAAAECGLREFTIDCGWHTCLHADPKTFWINNCGDWIPHPGKFPDGMKPVFESIRALGLKPGLWVSVASASEWAEVFRSHPGWHVQDPQGKPTNLHDRSKNLRTMCFGTDWKEYIREKLTFIAREWGVRYLKLDLAAVTSAYVNETSRSGCYATDHPGHKDHAESYIAIYEALFGLFDELHREFPDLYIDCTYETEGKMQAIDYAFRRHAEGNWLTNFEEPYPVGNFRIRNLAWWRSPAMPASSMLIGNRRLDTPEAINELRTMLGTFPILLGDLRAIAPEKRAEIKRWSEWITHLKEQYEYDIYRNDLPGFGEPTEGAWDAYARLNTDTRRGGLVGIFRQGAPDDRRTVLIPGLTPGARYAVKGDPSSPDFQTVYLTGRELAERGFEVHIPERYAGRLFEIEQIK